MSKYEPTQEELEAFIRRAGFSYGWENLESWARTMAERACIELREYESTKAAVTDEMVATFVEKVAVILSGAPFPSARSYAKAREISDLMLEAVAPMLASARVLDLENALRMVVAANAMLSEIEDNKTLYEGSPLHSTRCLLAWDNLNTAIANAKQVLAAAPKPESE